MVQATSLHALVSRCNAEEPCYILIQTFTVAKLQAFYFFAVSRKFLSTRSKIFLPTSTPRESSVLYTCEEIVYGEL